jgi:hypothetical protein
MIAPAWPSILAVSVTLLLIAFLFTKFTKGD